MAEKLGFIVWTMEEGGQLHAQWATRRQYETYVEDLIAGRRDSEKVAYIAFAEVADDFDLILDRKREASLG